MSTLKTQKTNEDVRAFILSFADSEEKKSDSFALIDIMREVTGQEPKMWGPSIIWFWSYHYKSEKSRQEWDWPLIWFSPRKTAISLYVFTGNPEHEYLLENLGKFKKGKACIYIQHVSDINIIQLKKIMQETIKFLEKKYKK